MQSTAQDDSISRIVPFLREGAGVTLTRGDVHYVVTEYGIAYLHGKNIRERAMELISIAHCPLPIAHPKFRSWLLEEAKKLNPIYKDQAFVPGKAGEYPEHLETYRTTKSGLNILLRPVKISDEPLLKDFLYSLSDQSMYQRFVSARKDMPHERLQEFVVIDYTKGMAIVAVFIRDTNQEEILELGQYGIDEGTLMANFALVVRDEWQGHGVGKEILGHLANLAKKQGLRGFPAEVLEENRAMFHLFESLGLQIEHRSAQGIHELRSPFKGRGSHEQ